MKNTLLLLGALFAVQSVFAQVTPSTIESPSEIYLLHSDFPGIRKGFTQMKLRTPAVNGDSYSTWYNYNVGINGNVITSTGYSDVDPAIPLVDELRTTGVRNGNTYNVTVELLDGSNWTPYEKQTAYFDANNRDTLWVTDDYDADNDEYVTSLKIEKQYTAEGNFAGYRLSGFEDGEWTLGLERVIQYAGTQRIFDTIYLHQSGSKIPFMYNSYTYASGRIDSVAATGLNTQTLAYEPVHSMKLTYGTDGGVDQIKTYKYINTNDSFFVESRADFIGGTVQSGLKEISAAQIEVYPVPAKETLNIRVKDAGTYSASIFDIQGRLMLSEAVKNNTSLNVSSLTNGIYILVLEHANGQKTQKRIMIGE